MGPHFRATVEDQRRQQSEFGKKKSTTNLKRSDIYHTHYQNEGQHVVVKHNLERVNDYTKNISQSIFSPGLMPNSSVSQQFRPGLPVRPKTVNHTAIKAKRLAHSLQQEKVKKMAMQREIKEIKQNLESIKKRI